MSEHQVLVLDPHGSDPDSEYRSLYERGPATLVDVLGVQAWSVSDPALLKQLLTDRRVSKDARLHWPGFADALAGWPLVLWVAVTNMFTAYGADHGRLRRMIAPAFSARRIVALQPAVETLVRAVLDDVEGAADDDGVVDLREHLAFPLPIAVIGQLMGVPEGHHEELRTVVDKVFATNLTADEAAVNTTALYGLLDRLIEAKRAAPGDDLTSVLITTRDGDGSALGESELRDTLLLMISAGYETTSTVIDEAITTLLSDAAQLAHVREGRSTWEDVVEETLRHSAAIKHLPLRFAVTDVELPDGRAIRQGEAILASFGAANRHPDWHGEDAHLFDATRPSKEHLAFGHGVHFCLGAPLARFEVATVLREFFARFPDAALATPRERLQRVPSLISNGHVSVPVRLRP
ncbi:cytochrome P450 [Myceligenerans crystallogenes]|uniref:cytochrome P450 family protein n=1 Tax=Myceligenerans crystallogenes TaxID=316335 RepID=UPI0031DA66DF